MKARNIITIISVIFALVSCSVESDILNDMNQPSVEASVEAFISCSINNIATKSGSDDKTINNVVFFLLNNEGDVLAYRTGSSSASFQAKSQTGLKVLAVANASTDVKGLSSEAAIMAQVLNENDLNSLVKVGSSAVTFNGTSAEVKIEVSQVAARIDLSKLNITISDADVVTLESVELVNQNVNGVMNGIVKEFSGNTVTANVNKVLENGKAIDNVCHFYSFANNTANATALKLNFNIDGKIVSTSVTIKNTDKSNAVVSGANHQLNLTLTIQGENVTPEVTFTVADWNKSNISVDMNE